MQQHLGNDCLFPLCFSIRGLLFFLFFAFLNIRRYDLIYFCKSLS
nr:MAG TPA: hypothetical protein [Caudoviricetes sp.]